MSPLQLGPRSAWPSRPRQLLVPILFTDSRARSAGGGRGLSGILVVGLPRVLPDGAGGVAAAGSGPVSTLRLPAVGFAAPVQP